MKKILVIASEFPPRGVGNVLRTVKLVKHLPSFGWKPYVLTVSLNSIARFDYSYDNDIPEEARVIRAFYPNPFVFMDRKWYRKTTKNEEQRANGGHGAEDTRYKGRAHNPETKVLSLKSNERPMLRVPKLLIKRAILSLIGFLRSHTFIPGWLVLWIPFAIAKGISICFREKIDIIYSTAPSYENHLVGLLIKILTGKKWTADYRDLWTDYPTRKISSRFRKKVEESMDAIVLKNADAVNIVSPMWRDLLLERFPFLSPEEITCYTNGFDSEDYLTGTQPRHSDPNRWRITYAGTVLHQYPTPLFLEALGELFLEIGGMKEKVKVDFYGNICDEQLTQINEVTGKIFEYIGVRKPVFAIVPKNGSAAEIIRKGNMGTIASPCSYEEIKNGLKHLYLSSRYNDHPFEPNWDYLYQFDRRYIIGKLTEIFGRLAFSAGDGDESKGFCRDTDL